MMTRFDIELCAALFAGFALPACDHAAAATKPAPVPVKVASVKRQTSAGPTRYSGFLEAASRLDVAFRVGGYVESLYEVKSPSGKHAVDKGDFVKKGTVLARVRPADYAEKVASARAHLAEARAADTFAAQDLDRAQILFGGRAISKAELDAKASRADSARAQVAAAAARTSEAEIALGDTVVRAPMDGVVLSRGVEVGSLVAPGQTALSLADTRTVKAVFGAPLALIERLGVGSPVDVFVGAEASSRAPEKLVRASVTRIAPAADSNGRVFSVEAALPNQEGSLRPGAVVSVHVSNAGGTDDGVILPLSSVVRSPNETRGFAVFVLHGDEHPSVRIRNVRLGEVVGNSVTVEQGVVLGQRVVTTGATLLHDGALVVVIP